MGTSEQLHSNLAIPPSEYLSEVLDERGMSQAELARRTGRPPQAINEMVHGEKAITPQTALQLEQVLRVPAHIWLGLEAEYQLVRARRQEEEGLTREADSLHDFPYSEMARFGWVQRTRDPMQKVRNLRGFFGVSSLIAIQSLGGTYAAAFRCAKAESASPHARAAWLKAAEDRARRADTQPFDAEGLREAVVRFRSLTRESPETFEPALRRDLAAVGVALVLLPHLPKTYANGATFWLTSSKAVLLMSIRGRWADIFWFSLFHEIGHLVLHDKRTVFVEAEGQQDLAQQEDEADEFARDSLIPKNSYAEFVQAGNFSGQSIVGFADQVGIAPGIVVGRLQWDERLRYSQLTQLKQRYAWKSEKSGAGS